ncbi:MAG: alpha/beta fold hydrolase [Pseudomonadota bacterium]
MTRRFFAVLFTLIAVFAAGWLAMRRPDIPYNKLETAYASPQSDFVALSSGDKVHFRDQGPRDAPVLVLVHGFSASLHTWEPWVARLKKDYRIVSLDLPGHGLTRSTLDTVSIPGFVATIDETTAKLGIDTFTLIGSSMGGAASWAYALEHGQRLDGLVLVGASGWPRAEEEDAERPIVFQLLDNPAARAFIKDLDLTNFIRSGLEESFADPSHVTDDMVARYAALSRAPGNREALLKLSAGGGDRIQATPELMARIDVPTLDLHGTQDKLVPVSGGRLFAEHIPGADVEIYEDIGHLPQEEAAKVSAQHLKAFLDARVHVDPAPDAVESPQMVSREGDLELARGSRP